MKRYGFTLVELMVAVAIVALVIGGILAVLTIGRQSWNIGNTQVELQQETRKAMDWMVRELRQSGERYVLEDPDDPEETITEPISLNDGDSANTITFRMSQGWDDVNERVDWGNQIIYSRSGNKLHRTSGGSITVLANNIVSLLFERSSNIIEISLQAEKDAIPGGRTMQSTLNSQVTLRN